MTVDTVVKIAESEKCGLDMSSYEDLHSSTNVGGSVNDNDNVNSDCNSDGKDDYVFVNDSDVVSSNDHTENHENGEVYEAKLSVEGDDNVKVNGDGESDRLKNGVKVDEDETNVENGVNVGEENREMDPRSEVVVVENCGSDGNIDCEVGISAGVPEVNEGSDLEPVVDEVEEGSVLESVVDEVKGTNDLKSVVDEVTESDDQIPVEDEVTDSNDQKPAVDEVKEGSVPEPVVDGMKESNDPKDVVDEVKEDELVFECGDNGNAPVDSIGCRSLDVDDNSKNSFYDGQEPAEVEAEDNIAGNSVPDAPEPSVVVELPEGELEKEQIMLPPENGIEIQGSEPERLEDQTGKPNVTENNGDVYGVEVPVTELESEDCLVVKSKPILTETDVSDRSVENGLAEAQSLDGDVKASVPLDDEDMALALVDTTPAQHSCDCQEQDLAPVIGENEKKDLIGAEAKIDKQGDVDPVAGSGSQESVGSEATGCELDHGEIRDQIGSNSAEETPDFESPPNQSEGAQNQENPVSIIVGQSDESKIESTDGVEENGEAVTADMQFDTAVKSDLEDEPERVDGDGESEVMDETGGRQEASPEEGVLHDHVVEQIGSVDVVDKEISSEDCISEKTLTLEDTTNMSKLQSVGNTAMDADPNDQGGSHSRDDISENKVVPPSDESSEEAGGDLRSGDIYLRLDNVEEVPSTSGLDSFNEREVIDDVSSAADNSLSGSAGDTSSQTNLENDNNSILSPVDDTKSETKTVKSDIEVAIKSNNVSDGLLKLEISFGSFGGDVLNLSTSVSTANGEALLKSPADGEALLKFPANGNHSDGLDHDTACTKVALPEQIDDVSASSVEESEAESSDVQNINPDLVRRPFCWLVKVPRFDEGKYKDLLRQSEIELAEKTKTRDVFQAEFNKQQAYCRELKSNRDAANSEVKAARELVWAKSREIDSAHSLINLARHAVTVVDLDNKILNLEHTLQHQTLNNLREEKELVREIKQLNLQRQKLFANPLKQQEVQQAQSQRGQTEEQLKVLKKELDALKDNLSKADERFRAAKKKHDDESALLNDLKQQLKSADDIRQEAYTHLKTIQKQLNEKNAPFYKAKNDLRVAYNYATAGKKDSLERHCVNQVEKIMEMWNKNDEFRKEYIQCNMRRTLWKFGTLDGTRLGINEVPPSLGDVSDKRVKNPANVNSATASLTVERDLPVVAKTTEDKLSKKVEQKKAPPVKKIEAISKNSLADAPGVIEIEEDTEEPKLTKEEEELARKSEQLRREEEAARLREQRRLEEKAKAEEALERKRRNAIKAQARAEFKARKEAEEKEKEREKRAKKKGKKKGINSEITENEPSQPSEPSSKSVKEPEITVKPATMIKRSQKVSLHSKQIKTTKPIPPALRNKGKRGLLRYWPYACVVLLAIALFYLGSFERIQTIKQLISALHH